MIFLLFESEGNLGWFDFLDYSFHFLKVGNLREGEALIVAKAVSPSRALPLLATPLWCVMECVSVSAQSCILLYRQWQTEPIIDSAMYSAALAVAGWADCCFGAVYCFCTACCFGADYCFCTVCCFWLNGKVACVADLFPGLWRIAVIQEQVCFADHFSCGANKKRLANIFTSA